MTTQTLNQTIATQKLLLVDDEEEITDLLGELLRAKGFSVETANNGLQAIDLAQRLQFDVVITDVRMPDMDGLTLMEKLKLLYPKLGFIVISGYSKQNESEILKRGAFKFLHKPVTPDLIIEAVNSFFNSSPR
jgi:two-component system response regulator AtoC